ncbi:hypothetical protein ABH945_000178 [Paraburkholderia sp. GAS333]|uniref:hypothetical protein n=1 Tax=Paraburkholderia sp. GAS333 TaxID=3156279 RepID=UPI003D233330
MTFRTAALAAATVSITLFGAASALTVHAQSTADNQWRSSPLTLSTLLQDGYKIVAVVNNAQSSSGPGDTIFVQRDQSAFKCIDPQQTDAKARAAASPACYELVPPSGAASGADSK